jgi:7-cyano-7-deazaguanine synthase
MLGSGDLAGKPPHANAPASDWWPFRNQFLLTVAAMHAVDLGVNRLLIGIVRSDSFHSDGTAEFVKRMNDVLMLQEGHVRVEAPAVQMTSVELIRQSGISLALLCWAHSCHTANQACGRCRGCNKHREIMAELGHGPY